MKRLLLFSAILFINNSYSQSLEWAKTFGGTNTDRGKAITIDNLGNVYTVGDFKSVSGDFNPNDGVNNLTTNGINDFFIQKLDSEGNFLWVKSIGGLNNDGAESIVVDDNGNLYITGFFIGTVDFNPDSGVSELTTPFNAANTYILKLDTNGNFIWVKHLSGHSNQPKSIHVDSGGNIYTTGVFFLGVDFDTSAGTLDLVSKGAADIFVHKLDSEGNFEWAKSFGADSIGDWDGGFGITTDNSENVFITGYFRDGIDFDPSDNIFNVSSNGSSDIFILKLNLNGSLVWVRSIGGAENDLGNSIKLDSNNNIYLTGRFKETVDFDPSDSEFNLTATGSGGFSDIFVLKLDVNGHFVWARSFGSEGNDEGEDLVLDAESNIYTVGDFKYTVDFDPSNEDFSLTVANDDANSDAFIQKLDSDGNFIWAVNIGGSSDDYGSSIVAINESIYATGRFFGTADFDPSGNDLSLSSVGGIDAFIIKLNQNTLSLTDEAKVLLNLYPNPTERYIEINSNIQVVECRLFTQTGKEIPVVLIDNKIDIQHISSGMYFLQLKTIQGMVTKKIIKGN